VLNFLSLFAADFNFSQPGCTGISTFADLFGVNVGGMSYVMLLCVLTMISDIRRIWIACVITLHTISGSGAQ